MFNRDERIARREARESDEAARINNAQLARERRHLADALGANLDTLDQQKLESATVGTLAGLAIDSIVAGNYSHYYAEKQAHYARATALANLALVRSVLYPEEIQADQPVTPETTQA